MTEISNVISAFTADQVVRLTGLTMGQLAYWDKTGFFRPQYASEKRSAYSRIYSFKDVVGLRTVSVLKNHFHVSLPHLRKVAKKLSAYTDRPWSEIKLKVWNRKVQFDEPDTGKTRGVVDGQYTLLPIASIMEDVLRAAEQLRRRDPAEIGKIGKHRYVSHNAPVFAGTRIKVATIVRFVEAGYSTAAILKEYPTLTEADIEAAKRYGTSGVAA
jgi:uncharacterized protein (DUF433 family)/DNA-binding transcriptional MerR regulator